MRKTIPRLVFITRGPFELEIQQAALTQPVNMGTVANSVQQLGKLSSTQPHAVVLTGLVVPLLL